MISSVSWLSGFATWASPSFELQAGLMVLVMSVAFLLAVGYFDSVPHGHGHGHGGDGEEDGGSFVHHTHDHGDDEGGGVQIRFSEMTENPYYSDKHSTHHKQDGGSSTTSSSRNDQQEQLAGERDSSADPGVVFSGHALGHSYFSSVVWVR